MKLAIIGASRGQLPICQKAKELNIETHCFAWEKGALCKDVVDYFYPISIIERDAIVDKCREIKIDGVVSNASEITAESTAYISEKLNLIGTPYQVIKRLRNKLYVRQLSENIKNLSKPRFYKYDGEDLNIYPCVIKPCNGRAKVGVSFAINKEGFKEAIQYAKKATDGDIIVEEYIEGKELSVESISYKGQHQVIQITDKDNVPGYHFIEVGHHQPANISKDLKEKIKEIIPTILNTIGYTNGASHIEIKYNRDSLYLIEVNLRGGGDDISNKLVQLSSGYDYLRCMIEVALDIYKKPTKLSEPAFSGIYYLCDQTKTLLPFFKSAFEKEWFIEGEIMNKDLRTSHNNYERDGYLIYKHIHKIIPNIT